ncbi:MAG: hypothetical protein ABJN26_16280 [Stappiaceae bacterium]
MRHLISLAILASLTGLTMTGSASACPNGYKRVNWQHSGNWICVFDTGIDTIAAPSKPDYPNKAKLKVKAKRR